MDTISGTGLPVQTHSDLWQVEVIGLGDTPRLRQDKVVPETGELTYTSGCCLRSRAKDGTVRSDKSVSVNVINQAAFYEIGQVYRAQGRIYVQPYESNGRVTLSIVVEQLVPVDGPTAPASSNGRAKADAAV